MTIKEYMDEFLPITMGINPWTWLLRLIQIVAIYLSSLYGAASWWHRLPIKAIAMLIAKRDYFLLLDAGFEHEDIRQMIDQEADQALGEAHLTAAYDEWAYNSADATPVEAYLLEDGLGRGPAHEREEEDSSEG